ncbi:hypothetical protein [Gorillibacterium sp. sgz500922]|uniref:hypothetical protein n=1 Tax=Gorillibacterium sp. sgz500922 TaxID=3446694 RepID=UPI003F67C5A0
MSKLDYPVWSYVIVAAAVLLPPGVKAVDWAVWIVRAGLAAGFTLLALHRSLTGTPASAEKRQVRRGALLGFAATVLAAFLLAKWTGPLRSGAFIGWLPVASACLLLTGGLRLHASDVTAAWRQKIRLAASNQIEAAGLRRGEWPMFGMLAAGILMRDGMESLLYLPALLACGGAGLLAGLLAGGGAVGLAVWGLPRLPVERPLRRLCCLLPALTLFLASRLVGDGIALLQGEGLMDAAPVSFWLFPTTWEWLGAQALLLGAAAAAALRFRKHSNDFIRQINL